MPPAHAATALCSMSFAQPQMAACPHPHESAPHRPLSCVRNMVRISSVPRFQGSVRWMSVPTLPHLNGPRARGFTYKPLQHGARAPSLSHTRSLTQRPTRPSAYTVPGRAQDSHPHSLKRARSSLTPAPCPTQPSLPITPGFYHDSYTHAQKHPRMWHSSAA